MPMISRRATLAGATLLAAAPIASQPAAATTPMLGPARATFYRFPLGAFEVTTLLDGTVQFDGPHPIFGQDQDAATVAAHAEANFLPADRMAISFAPVLVNTGTDLVLFDTGNPPARAPAAANLRSVLEAAGYTPEQVSVVVLTHFHGDHIGGLATDGAINFPNARVVTNENEYRFWSADERLSGATENSARLVRANVVPFAEQLEFVGDGSEVTSGITGVEAHGHTPGHMAYHLESEGERLLLWADTANHYVMSVQRPDWHVRFDLDKDAAAATRRRLLDLAAAERIPVTGYHMPFPAVGFIERTSDGYRWVQASYQMDL